MSETSEQHISDELAACPFCGGEALLHNAPGSSRLWAVSCKNCDAGPHGKWSPALAIAAWNRRAQPILPVAAKIAEATTLRGIVPDSVRRKAEALADSIWSELDDVRRETKLTDIWAIMAESCGDDIIRFAYEILSPITEKVAEGWVMVPKEPTDEMLNAPSHMSIETSQNLVEVWKDMIAAAPSSEGKP